MAQKKMHTEIKKNLYGNSDSEDLTELYVPGEELKNDREVVLEIAKSKRGRKKIHDQWSRVISI